jgi:hypothetical protein
MTSDLTLAERCAALRAASYVLPSLQPLSKEQLRIVFEQLLAINSNAFELILEGI